MEKVVLIGADILHSGGRQFHLGCSVPVDDAEANSLLSQTAPGGGRLFLRERELRRPLRVRLSDPSVPYRSAAFAINGQESIPVSKDILPHLLSKKRDEKPIFKLAGSDD